MFKACASISRMPSLATRRVCCYPRGFDRFHKPYARRGALYTDTLTDELDLR